MSTCRLDFTPVKTRNVAARPLPAQTFGSGRGGGGNFVLGCLYTASAFQFILQQASKGCDASCVPLPALC